MKLSVLNKAGQDTGKKVELKDTIFGIEPNDHAIYLMLNNTWQTVARGPAKQKKDQK